MFLISIDEFCAYRFPFIFFYFGKMRVRFRKGMMHMRQVYFVGKGVSQLVDFPAAYDHQLFLAIVFSELDALLYRGHILAALIF